MNNKVTKAAIEFKKNNVALIAQAKKGDVQSIKQYDQAASLAINRVIGLFDDFDQVRKEFDHLVRKTG
jgi:hypothetical protein